MAKHTPGPWTAEEATSNSIDIVSEEVEIATIISDEDFPEDCEERANARLIAAAPELLDALRDLADRAEGGVDYGLCHRGICSRSECAQCRRVDAARAAIAKAEGR